MSCVRELLHTAVCISWVKLVWYCTCCWLLAQYLAVRYSGSVTQGSLVDYTSVPEEPE